MVSVTDEPDVPADGQGDPAVPAASPAVPDPGALRREFLDIVRLCRSDVIAYRDIVLNGRESVGIHQVRVALRRLRAAIGLFKSVMGELIPGELVRVSGALASACGPVRDLDVFLDETLPAGVSALRASLSVERHAELERRASSMIRTARRLRRKRHNEAREALRGSGYDAFERQLDATIEALETTTPPESAVDMPLDVFAGDVLARRDRKVRKLGNRIDKLSPTELHQLRIRLKKLRYGATFLRHIFDSASGLAYVEAAAALQDALGAINDRAVAMNLLDMVMATTRPARASDWLAGALAAWLGIETERRRLQVDKAWRRFSSADRFWERAA